MDIASTKQAITSEQAIRFIQSRTAVNEAGKYTLGVIGNPVEYDGRMIVNLKAQTPKGLAKAKEHLRAGEYDKAANTNLSFNVFKDASFIPSKGDIISVMIEEVETKSGETVLAVTSHSEIKAKASKKVSLGDEFANLLDESSDDSNELG